MHAHIRANTERVGGKTERQGVFRVPREVAKGARPDARRSHADRGSGVARRRPARSGRAHGGRRPSPELARSSLPHGHVSAAAQGSAGGADGSPPQAFPAAGTWARRCAPAGRAIRRGARRAPPDAGASLGHLGRTDTCAQPRKVRPAGRTVRRRRPLPRPERGTGVARRRKARSGRAHGGRRPGFARSSRPHGHVRAAHRRGFARSSRPRRHVRAAAEGLAGRADGSPPQAFPAACAPSPERPRDSGTA